ncbi:hypothetical protein FM996_20490, partial [Methylosinus sporium]
MAVGDGEGPVLILRDGVIGERAPIARDRIAAGSDQKIVAFIALEHIGAVRSRHCAAHQNVVAALAIDNVVALIAEDEIAAVAAAQHVVSGAAVDVIIARIAGDGVVGDAADQNVIAPGAVEEGVGGHPRGVEHVVAIVADRLLHMRGGEVERHAERVIDLDDIEAAAAVYIGLRGRGVDEQKIVAGPAEQRQRSGSATEPIGARIVRIGEEDVIARRRIEAVGMRSVGQREIRHVDRMAGVVGHDIARDRLGSIGANDRRAGKLRQR